MAPVSRFAQVVRSANVCLILMAGAASIGTEAMPYDKLASVVRPSSPAAALEGVTAMSKKVRESAHQEQLGVSAVQKLVGHDLRWIFRVQATSDYGIDAQIEVVEGDVATGHLIAVQIKAGASYFRSSAEGGWWFPLEKDDLEYWLEHSLPVIVVIYDPDADAAYWQTVSERTITVGPKGGRKILIPRDQPLNAEAKKKLVQVADGNPFDVRVRQLLLALPWMTLLQNGHRLLLEADEWINKSSGRGEIRIVSYDESTGNCKELSSWGIFAGLRPYDEVLQALVPWADLEIHAETYEEADCEAWEAECVHYDYEGDRYVSESYSDWSSAEVQEGRLRPYKNGGGEVDFWRLELTLNDLGNGFLAVKRYADGDGWILTPRP